MKLKYYFLAAGIAAIATNGISQTLFGIVGVNFYFLHSFKLLFYIYLTIQIGIFTVLYFKFVEFFKNPPDLGDVNKIEVEP